MDDHQKHIKVHVDAYEDYIKSHAELMVGYFKSFYGYNKEEDAFYLPSELE